MRLKLQDGVAFIEADTDHEIERLREMSGTVVELSTVGSAQANCSRPSDQTLSKASLE